MRAEKIFLVSDEVGAASRGVAAWRRGVAIGRHFTLNFIQAISGLPQPFLIQRKSRQCRTADSQVVILY